MASTVVPPPGLRRWTRAEYERLVALGVFQPGERLELLDGQLLVREPQGSRHAGTIRRVQHSAARSARPGRSTRSFRSRSTTTRSPSPTLPWCRAIPTASLYARAGITDYWIVDLVHDTLEVHREPEASPAARYDWRYRTVATLRPPATVAPLVAPARSILRLSAYAVELTRLECREGV